MTLQNTSGEETPRTADPRIKAREHNQRTRIHEGVKTGELTKDEAKGLRSEERAIHQEEHQFKADGKLTPAERAKLKTDLNKSSRDIYREKHDGEKRTTTPPIPPVPPALKPAN
jgi:hypothetical protein